MPPIDPAKIEEKVQQLNDAERFPEDRKWFAADGYHALTVFTYAAQPIFNPYNGIPIKVFSNRATGEIRTFDARSFRVTGT